MGIDEEALERWLKANPDLKVLEDTRVNVQQSEAQQSNVHKYRAQRTEYGGRKFASKKEAGYAAGLDLQQKAGKIKGYIEQVKFRLPGGTSHRIDFGVLELDGTVTWWEVKGRDLELGKIKRKQVEELYKIQVLVV